MYELVGGGCKHSVHSLAFYRKKLPTPSREYCGKFLAEPMASSPGLLQPILHQAATVPMKHKAHHDTLLLQNFHPSPITIRIKYKLQSYADKILHNLGAKTLSFRRSEHSPQTRGYSGHLRTFVLPLPSAGMLSPPDLARACPFLYFRKAFALMSLFQSLSSLPFWYILSPHLALFFFMASISSFH